MGGGGRWNLLLSISKKKIGYTQQVSTLKLEKLKTSAQSFDVLCNQKYSTLNITKAC